ncbi:MAG: zf-HC2 domain-containing protein [Aristaeellaceae bacterium]
MKYDCEFIRDLMPLCNDGTCSELSRRMVGEHVLECPACMQMYQEMRTEVPGEPPVQPDAVPFGKTVKQLRRKRGKRRALAVLAGVIVGLVLMLGGLYVLRCMTSVYNHVSANGEYEFELYRRANGQIIYTMSNLSGRKQKPFYAYDQTTGVLSMYALHPFLALPTSTNKTDFISSDLHWDEELGLMIRSYHAYGYSDRPVLEVRQGGVYESSPEQLQSILYVQGQDIPLVSPDKDAAYDVLQPPDPQRNGQDADLLPFITPAPTALPLATVPPTLEPRQSIAVPIGSTPTPLPTDQRDDHQATITNPAVDSLLTQTLQTIVAVRETTPSDMPFITPTPLPTP